VKESVDVRPRDAGASHRFVFLEIENPALWAGFFFSVSKSRLDNRDIRRLKALGALLDIEFNRISFVQALESSACDRLKVDEYIFATLT
jgi:hypothetical protein